MKDSAGESQQQKFLKIALSNNQAISIESIKGDGSDRLYFRVFQGKSSFILMQLQKPYSSFNSFLNIQNYFEHNNITVPKVKFYKENLGMILLEDLGDTTLEDTFWKKSPHLLTFYQQAIDELVKVHHHKKSDQLSCTAFHVIFDTKKLIDEMIYCQNHLLEEFCQIPLTMKTKKALNKDFTDLCCLLDQKQKYMIHRDYHSRNLMIKEGKVYIIDFQDARMAPCQYDLVSLLKDAYVNMNKKMENQLIDYYILKSKEFNFQTSKDEFMKFYQLCSIQRCFKMCGSFASFYNIKKDKNYLKYIPRTLQNFLNDLSDSSDYPTLKSILIDHNLTHRTY